MTRVAIVLSLVIAAWGAVGLVSPETMAEFSRPLEEPYAAAALRVVVGGVLALAAPTSRAPRTLRVVGLAMFMAGLATPFVAVVLEANLDLEVHDWWFAQGPLFIRILAGITLAIGLGLMFVVRRSPTAA